LTQDQVLQLLGACGTLRSLALATDTSTGESRGFAFCEYMDEENTEVALHGLNGADVGGQPIKVQRACEGIVQEIKGEVNAAAIIKLAAVCHNTPSTPIQTRCVRLSNLSSAESLMKPSEYEDVMEDMEDKCSEFGTVLEVKMPRPAGARSSPAVGDIFVKFESLEDAVGAWKGIAGMSYTDRTAVTSFVGEDCFECEGW